MIIILARFLNSRMCPPRESRENKNLANITRSTVVNGNGVQSQGQLTSQR